MAIYPGAVKRLIAPGANDPAIKVVGAILHVDAGDVRDLHDYFNGPSGGIESHFQIPKHGPGPFQYRDTGREADANLKANSFVENGVRKGFVSIETQGLEGGEWNAYQLDEIKKLLSWLSHEHDFPLRVCPGPFKPGVGYHILFGSPGPWTPVSKSCPGPRRIAQFNKILVPWFKGTPEPTPEPDVPITNAEIASIAKAVFDTPVIVNANGPGPRSLATVVAEIENQQDASDARLKSIENKLDTLIAALAAK